MEGHLTPWNESQEQEALFLARVLAGKAEAEIFLPLVIISTQISQP